MTSHSYTWTRMYSENLKREGATEKGRENIGCVNEMETDDKTEWKKTKKKAQWREKM